MPHKAQDEGKDGAANRCLEKCLGGGDEAPAAASAAAPLLSEPVASMSWTGEPPPRSPISLVSGVAAATPSVSTQQGGGKGEARTHHVQEQSLWKCCVISRHV